jgi:CubicO group peptidase (beta-lactamase class C family)
MQVRFPVVAAFLIGLLTLLYTQWYEEPSPPERKAAAFLSASPTWADSVLVTLNRDELLEQLLMVRVKPDSLGALPAAGGLVFAGSMPDSFPPALGLPPLLASLPGPATDGRLQWPQGLAPAAIREDSLLYRTANYLAARDHRRPAHLYAFPARHQEQTATNRPALLQYLSYAHEALQHRHRLLALTGSQVYQPQLRDSVLRDSALWFYEQLAWEGLPVIWLDSGVVNHIHPFSQRKDLIQAYAARYLDFRGLLIAPVSRQGASLPLEIEQMIKAGVDMIYVQDLRQWPMVLELLRQQWEIQPGFKSWVRQRVRRILLAKTWVGAHLPPPPFWEGPQADSPELAYELAAGMLTLAKNSNNLLPLSNQDAASLEVLYVGEAMPVMTQALQWYSPVRSFELQLDAEGHWPDLPWQVERSRGPLVVALAPSDSWPEKSPAWRALCEQRPVIVVNFDEVERLRLWAQAGAQVQAYQVGEAQQQLAGELLFGGMSPRGRLPLALSESQPFGHSLNLARIRLGTVPPGLVGLDPERLQQIDSIVQEGIGAYAMPGCQVLVARHGQVVYHKAFGHHTYARRRPVQLGDLYDLASITKVAATTLATMKLRGAGKLRLESRLNEVFRGVWVKMDSVLAVDTLLWVGDSVRKRALADSLFQWVVARNGQEWEPEQIYLDTLLVTPDSLMIMRTAVQGQASQKSPLFQVRVADLLTHSSGLPAGLPVLRFLRYRDATTGRYGRYFHARPDSFHTIEVAQNFFLRRDYLDSIWTDTKRTRLSPLRTYHYSDANMVLLQQMIDSLNQQPLNEYLDQALYKPLGLQRLGFLPKGRFDLGELVPTEYDGAWRGQLLRGYVHDPTAALFGGVAGNAGLFSNAYDLAVLFQMLMNEGQYGGQQHLAPGVVREFTRTQVGHRGYGFDKPPLNEPYIVASSASGQAFGHTGFTGTCVWADPETGLLFVFLSNRVHPKASNWKLNELRIRQRIHQVVYDALMDREEAVFIAETHSAPH